MTDLCHLPAHELIHLMSDKSVSCREVIEAHLARIDAVNPTLNALVAATDPQRCLDAADEADNRAARGDPLGKAHGLPVVIKDVIRVAALSLGSDDGGSIRQPCHNTGIAGLKPTHGRIPRTGSVFGDGLGVFGPFNCYGPLARTVADLYLGLSVMSGPDLQDPYAVPAPLGRPDEVDLASLRVATYLDDGISPPADDVAGVVEATARAMTEVAAVENNAPGCVGRTMELLREPVFLGGDRGRGFEEDLRAIGATDPSASRC